MLGKMAALTPGIANWANRQPLLRVLMEHTLGIHREKLLPGLLRRDLHGLGPEAARALQVTLRVRCLFVTCSMNYNNPQLGKDVLEVFRQERASRWWR